MADVSFLTSQCEVGHLYGALQGLHRFCVVPHRKTIDIVRTVMKEKQTETAMERLSALTTREDGPTEATLEYLREGWVGTWLAVMPSEDMATLVGAVTWRDAARDRLELPLLKPPTHCDGCGGTWTADHALNCSFGGLVISRHNECREKIINIACDAYTPSQV